MVTDYIQIAIVTVRLEYPSTHPYFIHTTYASGLHGNWSQPQLISSNRCGRLWEHRDEQPFTHMHTHYGQFRVAS